MAITVVPKPARAGLALLLRLSDKTVDEVFSSLLNCGVPPPTDPTSMAQCISKGTDLEASKVTDLARALASLYGYRAVADLEATSVVEELLSAMAGSGDDELTPKPGEDVRLKQRLERLLGVEEVVTLFKATALASEHLNLMSAVKIVTDIRPVFGKDATREPIGAVLVNVLNFHYFTGGDHREFSVALDDDDLKNLKNAVDRAEKKLASLAVLMQRVGIRRFESE